MNDIIHISDLQSDVVNSITKGAPKIPLSLKELDMKLYGFEPGDFILIAGRPSMGKTALCIQIALDIARKFRVLFISLETPKTRLFMRMISHLSGQRLQSIKSGETPLEILLPYINKINKRHLYFSSDDFGKTSFDVRNILQQNKFDCVFIDYLQLLRDEGESYTRITDISRNLQSFAQEIKIPIIAASQLNRLPNNVEIRRPRMSDLRESGYLEQDASKILLIHRPDYYRKGEDLQEEEIGCAEIIVEKNREGETGVVKVKWIPETMSFVEFDKQF